jgi:hypothetical protein
VHHSRSHAGCLSGVKVSTGSPCKKAWGGGNAKIGGVALVAAEIGSNPTSSALTQERLGWSPEGPALIPDIEQGHYFTV